MNQLKWATALMLCLSLNACSENNRAQILPDSTSADASTNVNSQTGGARNERRNLRFSVETGQSVAIELNNIDIPEGASVVPIYMPAHGLFEFNTDNKVVYTASADYLGADEFKYSLIQSNGQVDVYTVSLNIIENQNSEAGAAIETPAVQLSIEQITPWKGNATAAYSIVHDDMCSAASPSLETHWHELTQRGLVAGFGPIVKFCSEYNWDTMKEMQAAGNEIVNHSFSHPFHGGKGLAANGVNLDEELRLSTEVLERELTPGTKVTFFIFPYDSWDAGEYLFSELRNIGYLGARGGKRGGINSPDIVDVDDLLVNFKVGFDCYNDNRNSGGSCSEYGNVEPLDAYLNDAIYQGGWAVRELHGIEDNSWGNVPLSDYTQHLDTVAEKVSTNELWMDTPTNILKYRATRAFCGSATFNDSVISFDPVLSQSERCLKFSTPVTVKVSTAEEDSIKATQNGIQLPVKKTAENQFLLDINPALGEAVIARP